MTARTILVAGTGTGVGKTHVACALLRAWAERGEQVVGLKPIETGVEAGDEGTDQALLDGATFHVKRSDGAFHVKRSPYRLVPPVSPHLAARLAGTRIDLAILHRWCREARGGRSAVVETAGGLFSPIAPGITNLDLALALGPAPLVLVAPDRLGVLHDVTATLGLLRSLGHRAHAVVLSAPSAPDASTGTNARELELLGIARVAAEFPRADP